MSRESNDGRTVSDTASAQGRLLLLMDHSLDFIELLGREGVIDGVSSAITLLAGYEPKDLIGRHYEDLIHPDDHALVAGAFAEVLARGHAGPLMLRYRRKDGAWRTIQASARNYLADSAARAIVVLTRDLTDQLNAERLLSEANAELHRLSQELISAQEAERGHLARELHDDVVQILAALSLSMAGKSGVVDGVPPASRVEKWKSMVQDAIEHLRRLVLNLRPPALNEQGLPHALALHVDRARTIAAQELDLDIDANLGRLDPEVEISCFRIIQEALTNAVKHSKAQKIWIAVRRVAGGLCATVRDNGAGFDVAGARDGATRDGSIGLLSMRERATLVGGALEIQSTPGRGTVVRATFPIR
jgi:two-component system, NarL family, sensor histidine kinase UhpB